VLITFINWLCHPEAEPIRIKILDGLGKLTEKRLEHLSKENRLPNVISQFLDTLWDKNRSQLRPGMTNRKTFENLLYFSAMYNDPLALELQARITSR
jgi:hypothetical protein